MQSCKSCHSWGIGCNRFAWILTILVCAGLVYCACSTGFTEGALKESGGLLADNPLIGLAGVLPAGFGAFKAIQGVCGIHSDYKTYQKRENKDVSKREWFSYNALYVLFALMLCAGGVLFGLYGGASHINIGMHCARSFVLPGTILLCSGVGLFGVLGVYNSGMLSEHKTSSYAKELLTLSDDSLDEDDQQLLAEAASKVLKTGNSTYYGDDDRMQQMAEIAQEAAAVSQPPAAHAPPASQRKSTTGTEADYEDYPEEVEQSLVSEAASRSSTSTCNTAISTTFTGALNQDLYVPEPTTNRPRSQSVPSMNGKGNLIHQAPAVAGASGKCLYGPKCRKLSKVPTHCRGCSRRRLLESSPVRPLLARLQGQIASAVAADNARV